MIRKPCIGPRLNLCGHPVRITGIGPPPNGESPHARARVHAAADLVFRQVEAGIDPSHALRTLQILFEAAQERAAAREERLPPAQLAEKIRVIGDRTKWRLQRVGS